MVFMRNRRSEQREYPVAGRLHDVTAVTVYSFHHQLERGIDNGTRLLRVEVLHQLHRALYVRKESGDGLALTIGYIAGSQGCLSSVGGFRRAVGRVAAWSGWNAEAGLTDEPHS